jgi:hypothetical protein
MNTKYIRHEEKKEMNDLRKVYQGTTTYHLYKTKDYKFDEAAGKMLTWLGLARPDRKAVTGYRPTDFLFDIKKELAETSRRSRQRSAYYADIDVFESAYEGAFGNARLHPVVKRFLVDVLWAIGLVKIAKGGDPIPTRFLRKLVATVRQQDRYDREGSKRKRHRWDQVDRERTLAKEKGRRIDPEIAEGCSWCVEVVDPDALAAALPWESCNVGCDYFVRSPRGKWFWEGYVPNKVVRRIAERYHKAQSAANKRDAQMRESVAKVNAQADEEDEPDDEYDPLARAIQK